MQEYLKHYQMRITAMSPIYVGDGNLIGKKEYIRKTPGQPIIIPDLLKMFADLQKMKKEQAFERFMLEDMRGDLGRWLAEQRITDKQIESWAKYSLYSRDAFIKPQNGRAATPKGIQTFIKDAYGMPYVPGSCLKGMIRTALLVKKVKDHPEAFSRQKQDIAASEGSRGSRNTFLKRETDNLETAVFHTLNRNEKRKSDAVNSVMAGMIVSDSQPISMKQLTLSQKIDYNLEGRETPLPILRETLIPGTEIDFEITIDSSICPYQIEDILNALEEFQKESYKYFYSRFHRGSQEKGTVWLGGGVGFLSKTVLYPLFGEQAVGIADSVFQNTLGKKYYEHKHMQDRRKRLAPHVCKCTRYRGQLYDMGRGKIERIR